MATKTLAQLRTRAKSLADMVGGSFVADSEWLDFINAGCDELHGFLARSGAPWVESTTSFTTAGAEYLTLPATFFRHTGVDIQVSGKWRSMRPFDWDERNALRNVSSSGFSTRYCIRGGKLYTLPIPPSGLTVNLNFIPVLTPLALDASSIDCVNGWDEYIATFAAIRALRKEESDTSVLERELQRLEARIRSEASTRDAENPPVVREVDGGAEDELDEERAYRWG